MKRGYLIEDNSIAQKIKLLAEQLDNEKFACYSQFLRAVSVLVWTWHSTLSVASKVLLCTVKI